MCMLFQKDKILAAGLSDLLIQLDKMYRSGNIQDSVLDTLNTTIYQIINEQSEPVQNVINRALVRYYTGFSQRGAK